MRQILIFKIGSLGVFWECSEKAEKIFHLFLKKATPSRENFRFATVTSIKNLKRKGEK